MPYTADKPPLPETPAEFRARIPAGGSTSTTPTGPAFRGSAPSRPGRTGTSRSASRSSYPASVRRI